MLTTTIHSTRVTCFPVHKSKKNLPPSSLDLNLVSSLFRRALKSTLYRRDFRDFDHPKHVLLVTLLGTISQAEY